MEIIVEQPALYIPFNAKSLYYLIYDCINRYIKGKCLRFPALCEFHNDFYGLFFNAFAR